MLLFTKGMNVLCLTVLFLHQALLFVLILIMTQQKQKSHCDHTNWWQSQMFQD